jgi:hypothetical protein
MVIDRNRIKIEAADSCRTILMNKLDTDAYAEGDATDRISLDEFLRANESEIRWQVESLVLEQVTRAIGRENLDKVTLTFQGSALDNLAVHVEGPDDLRARIEVALLNR